MSGTVEVDHGRAPRCSARNLARTPPGFYGLRCQLDKGHEKDHAALVEGGLVASWGDGCSLRVVEGEASALASFSGSAELQARGLLPP